MTGTERFRKRSLGGGERPGLKVRGYTPPSSSARSLLASSPAKPRVHPETARSRRRTAAGRARRRPRSLQRAHHGRLVDHGVATYRHDPHEPVSYFVKVETPEGEREIWGVDLKRALRIAHAAPNWR